jgi:hypothetical protein
MLSHQHDARTNGMSILGAAMIYPILEEQFVAERFGCHQKSALRPCLSPQKRQCVQLFIAIA